MVHTYMNTEHANLLDSISEVVDVVSTHRVETVVDHTCTSKEVLHLLFNRTLFIGIDQLYIGGILQ